MDGERALTQTELLYQRDSGLRSVEGTIVAVDAKSRLIALDRTVIFPGGGGQPCDVGTLTRLEDGHRWPVTSARKIADVVWHELGGEDPLPEVADAARVDLDW